MGRVYAASFSEVAVTAQVDFFEILAASGKPFQIHSLHLSQSSDAGDAESEGLGLLVRRVTGAPTSGSGGSTATPTPLVPNDTASGATVETNNTTQLSGGTSTTLHACAFNVLSGLDIIWTPETRPVIDASTRVVVELLTTPADSLTLSGTIYFEELV